MYTKANNNKAASRSGGSARKEKRLTDAPDGDLRHSDGGSGLQTFDVGRNAPIGEFLSKVCRIRHSTIAATRERAEAPE